MTKKKANIIEESNIFEQIRTLFGLEEDCGFTDEEMQQFHRMGQILLHELEKAPQDILGQCYMQLELANKQRGQCFTPLSIGNLMANCLFHQAIEQQGYYTLNEPTCGSGALIIAFCKTMREKGYNPQTQLRVIAQDIDLKSVQM